MAEAASTQSEVEFVSRQSQEVLCLTLHKPETKSRRQVKWQEGVVDNEFLGKKTSKCCCIYSPPHKFGESDTEGSDSDDDCCHEHRVARKKDAPKVHPSSTR